MEYGSKYFQKIVISFTAWSYIYYSPTLKKWSYIRFAMCFRHSLTSLFF